MKRSALQDEQDPGTHSSGVKSGFLTPRERLTRMKKEFGNTEYKGPQV